MKRPFVSRLFILAAFYDGVLGLAFVLAPASVFEWFGAAPPSHWAYVYFPAALLIVFALMFLAVARDPESNRNLIPYGVLLKISYCAVAFGYWMAAGIPAMWKPFAIADVVFAALFVWTYLSLPVGPPRRW